MTPKEVEFEILVHSKQEREDKVSDLREWRRLKDNEEEAIALYADLGGDLDKYTTQMRTRDQMEMEYQCQRKRQKEIDLNPQRAREAAYAMTLERIRVTQAEERAMVQEMIRNIDLSNLEARVQASSNPKSITNTTGSQQASHVEADSSRYEEEMNKPSPEDIRRQFLAQAQDKARLLPARISRPIPSAEAGLSRHQEQENELSPERICGKSRAHIRARPAATTRMPTIITNVHPVPFETVASARNVRPSEPDISAPEASEDYFTPKIAIDQPHMGIDHHGVY